MKYFNINRRVCGAVLAVIVACTGCKKSYLDVNNDPNRGTDANIIADYIFPQAAHNVGVRISSPNVQFIENWMGYFAQAGDYSIQQDETSYNISFNFGDVLWDNNYNVLYDLYLSKQKAQAAGDSVLAGCSMILSARVWQDVVDIFGNVPYSDAFKGTGNRTPAYDKGQDIYAALQKSLDSAIIYLKGTPKSTFGATDVVNNGDVTLWAKFANTLKLRLLIRQSQMSGFDPAAELAKIAANGAGFVEAGGSINVNPGYSNQKDKQSPFYANYGKTPSGAEASASTRANAYIVDLLTNTNDPRLERYFKEPKDGGPITGCVYGLSAGNPVGSESSTFGPGLANSASQNQWLMPSFESLFLQAEAIARNWLPGNAKGAYEDAVKESFTWLGVPNANTAASNYMAANTIADWANAGSSVLDKAKFIAYQKYIALCGIDPVEAWSDLRRLDMIPDKGYISENTTHTSIPIRLLYPQSEYTTNGANARAQGNIDLFTSKIFWQP